MTNKKKNTLTLAIIMLILFATFSFSYAFFDDLFVENRISVDELSIGSAGLSGLNITSSGQMSLNVDPTLLTNDGTSQDIIGSNAVLSVSSFEGEVCSYNIYYDLIGDEIDKRYDQGGNLYSEVELAVLFNGYPVSFNVAEFSYGRNLLYSGVVQDGSSDTFDTHLVFHSIAGINQDNLLFKKLTGNMIVEVGECFTDGSLKKILLNAVDSYDYVSGDAIVKYSDSDLVGDFYYFVGDDPNNYLCLDSSCSQLYRIVGFYPAVYVSKNFNNRYLYSSQQDKDLIANGFDGYFKIVPVEPLDDLEFYNEEFCNEDFLGSNLYSKLNNEYYNTIKSNSYVLKDSIWYLNNNINFNHEGICIPYENLLTNAQMYYQINKTLLLKYSFNNNKVASFPVGLLSIADVFKTGSWIYPDSGNTRFILNFANTYNGGEYNYLSLYDDGDIKYTIYSQPSEVLPAFYINSDINVSGSGVSTNPYIIVD